jgi:trehalose utilization protein
LSRPIRVVVWNEYLHERERKAVRAIYPEGIHGRIAEHLRGEPDMEVSTATMDEPEHGLSESVLAGTDVVVWWGHKGNNAVADAVADRVVSRVLGGMGFIALHSAHGSKPFGRLMGTSRRIKWREAGERERVWVIEPGHPVCDGLGCEYIDIERSEMYGERFDIPAPDELVFISWFQGGEVYRSGCAWRRGKGRVFYFSPGHEDYPIYHNEKVLKVISNAVRWARPTDSPTVTVGNWKPLEPLPGS